MRIPLPGSSLMQAAGLCLFRAWRLHAQRYTSTHFSGYIRVCCLVLLPVSMPPDTCHQDYSKTDQYLHWLLLTDDPVVGRRGCTRWTQTWKTQQHERWKSTLTTIEPFMTSSECPTTLPKTTLVTTKSMTQQYCIDFQVAKHINSTFTEPQSRMSMHLNVKNLSKKVQLGLMVAGK